MFVDPERCYLAVYYGCDRHVSENLRFRLRYGKPHKSEIVYYFWHFRSTAWRLAAAFVECAVCAFIAEFALFAFCSRSIEAEAV